MELAHHDDIPLGAAVDARTLVIPVGTQLQVASFQGMCSLLNESKITITGKITRLVDGAMAARLIS